MTSQTKGPAVMRLTEPARETKLSAEEYNTVREVVLDDGIIDRSAYPLLPEGDYLATFTGHDTKITFKTPKVFCHFRIADGPHRGAKLFATYPVKELIGKPGKGGRFKLKARCKLLSTLCRLYEYKTRPDRISLRSMRHCLFSVKVRTVKTDYTQKPIPECLRYSIVDDVNSLQAGTACTY